MIGLSLSLTRLGVGPIAPSDAWTDQLGNYWTDQSGNYWTA